MFIQTEATPNPATLKFLPGRTVLDEGTAEFRSQDEAAPSPLALRLFEVPGVAGVFFGNDFITVTKEERDEPGFEWQHLRPAILGAIMEHYTSGRPVIEGSHDTNAAVLRNSSRKATARSSTPSRNCWRRAYARPLRRMAATSPSAASRKASSTCTCAAPAPVARLRRQR